jgi:hypothetical protein
MFPSPDKISIISSFSNIEITSYFLISTSLVVFDEVLSPKFNYIPPASSDALNYNI